MYLFRVSILLSPQTITTEFLTQFIVYKDAHDLQTNVIYLGVF